MMKAEASSPQIPQQSQATPMQPQSQQPATPTPSYTTTQWTTTPHMVIDPVLQQQSAQQSHLAQQHATQAAAAYHYQTYYPQAAYPTHYPYSTPQATQQQQAQQLQLQQQQQQQQQPPPQVQQQQLQRPPTAATVPTQQQQMTSGGMDTADIATLNDALGSAGVDLRAEEESLQRTGSSDIHAYHQSTTPYRTYEDRTRKQPPKPAFDTRILGASMRTISTSHKVTKVPEDSVNYLALALRFRLQDLVEGMVKAARHRTEGQFDRPPGLYPSGDTEEGKEGEGEPMWSILIRSDVAKQIAVLEKVEREEEMRVRRERKERIEMAVQHAAALAASGPAASSPLPSSNDMLVDENNLEGSGSSKKKRKKELGPGVTAKNMSEDVRKKMSNAVATQAAGLGGKYSWMTAAASSPAMTKPKHTPAPTTATPSKPDGGGAGSTWAKPYVPTKKSGTPVPSTATNGTAGALAEEDTRLVVTMRDALFVVDKERGHGAGRGAARGWAVGAS